MAPKKKSLRLIFACNIRTLRKRRGLSQEQLAKASGVSTQYISLLENNDRNVTIDVIEAIGKALGVRAIELFEDDAQTSASPAKSIRDAIKLMQDVEKKLTASQP